MGLSSRCGCRCECVTSTTHGDVVRNRSNRNNNDAPDAVLEGLAMAGLVAILRQLGDLAELAAEVFDDMQHQVMAASARGRRLAVRAKRLLETDLYLPPTTSTHNSAAAALSLTIATSSSGRLGCRAHPRRGGGGGGGGGTPPIMMPRLVVQRIRRCRGPPRLSLLDKFDAAGDGACLKRYTDPSFFFRTHSARLEQGTLGVRANRGPYLKSMSMETSRPKFQTAFNSEPPESADNVTDCKSESETERDASEAPSPGFLSMLRQLKQHRHRHRQAAGAGSLFRVQQTVDRVQSSPQLDMEKKLQGSGTAQPSPSPSELERTSSFEAWLSPDARRFPTTAAAAATHHHEHEEIITQEPPHPHGASATACSGSVSDVVTTSIGAALSSSTMLKAKQNSADAEIPCSKSSRRYKDSVEMIASRVSSLPRKLFINIKHHNDCSRSDRAGTTNLRISQATGTGDCSPELEAIPTPREAFLPTLVHSDPVYSSMHSLLLPENDKCYSYLQHHESIPCNVSVDAERHHQQEDPSTDRCSNSNSNSSTPETCTTPDSRNLLLPGSLVLKRASALPENPCSEDAKLDTTPPLPPIPPMQWLSERVHTGTRTRAPSPKHRALWKKSLEVTEMIQAIRQAHSHSIQTSPVDTEETLVSNEHTSANASHRDEMKCSESEETGHPQPFRAREDAVQASEGNVLKAGEFPVPAILSDEAGSEIYLRTQAQADTCFQQQGRQQFGSSGHSDHGSTEKRSEEHEDLQNESVFFSAVQELANMSPPPSVPRPKYPLLDAGSHGRIMLRNGPSPIHPSRNILDSRSLLIKQIKDIAMDGNPSFKLKSVSGASSPQSSVTGSPTNSKVATILQRLDDIRKAHANNNEVHSEESWSDGSE
ncbi:hypothetical protein BDA96_02G448500 [Sorghum bicolor]|uniref:Protein SCAR n=1 Tax=Sorghum bicolor TaxID=4558 RepID=A0A921RVX0_SORBI|nr:hypothetical protein BDA96_02G448500 [Sorghum bicolor]